MVEVSHDCRTAAGGLQTMQPTQASLWLRPSPIASVLEREMFSEAEAQASSAGSTGAPEATGLMAASPGARPTSR
jgi:hypothetical protein